MAMNRIRDLLGLEETNSLTNSIANDLSVVLGRDVKVEQGRTILKWEDQWKDDENEGAVMF